MTERERIKNRYTNNIFLLTIIWIVTFYILLFYANYYTDLSPKSISTVAIREAEMKLITFLIAFVLFSLIALLYYIFSRKKIMQIVHEEWVKAEREYEKHIKEEQEFCQRLTSGDETITPEKFFDIKKFNKMNDFTGVYIIYNHDKKMFYVGQAVRILFRVNQHFTGHGNGDVYADYKYGDTFTIRLLPLSESGFNSLDEFEKDMIQKTNAYENGYNKTHGNG